MKKVLFVLSLITVFSFTQSTAQILNNSFETWELDTFYLGAGEISSLPADTISFYDPVNWSTSNMLSGLDSLGGVSFVTESSTAYHGNSSIRLITDTVDLPVIPGFPALNITIPGFALNGDFPITAESLTSGGSVISPISIKGAGQPFTQKLGKIKGYYNYTPVFNPNTGSNDTCIIWATLRKGDTAVADAIFKSTVATTGFVPFEADFVYNSCLDPDTLVIFLASSVPNIAEILNATSGLVPGSVLLVDSIYYDAAPVNFAPIARPDVETTDKNVPINVFVKTNDEDCNDANSTLTVAVTAGPFHGTHVIAAGAITYTPGTDYVGLDTIVYTVTDPGGLSSTATVRLIVLDVVGINETNTTPLYLYPVPTADVLNVQFENQGRATLRMFDMLGNIVITSTLTKNNNQVNVADLPNAVYSIQILDEKNVVIARSKFTVSK